MAFIPAANTAQVKIVQRLHSQEVINQIYVFNETGWSSAELTALCNLVIAWWNDSLADELSSDMTLTKVTARDMTTEESAGVEIGAPPGSGGNVVGVGAMPGNVCVAVKFITGLTGPNRRGRNFVSGMPESVVNGNQVTDAWRDQLVLDYGELRDDLLAAGYAHVVASFYNGTALVPGPGGQTLRRPVPRPAGLVTTIETYTADANTDSQRRRLTGRGA